MKGLVFNVKKYAIHDGPGIRVTFFLKGCPLNCWWCHNPEGVDGGKAQVERVDRIGDKEFVSYEDVGTEFTVEEVVEIAGRENVFFHNSGGGITFSGGEPMMQLPFLKSSLEALNKLGYHTAVDTSGYASPGSFREIMPYTSLFLFDLKHMDDASHIRYSGVSNEIILSNYRMLVGSGTDMMVRIPVVPGINDDERNIRASRDFIAANMSPGLREINLLPFHRTGSSKYRRFGLECRMGDTKQPSRERLQEIAAVFADIGVRVKIGG